MPERLDRPHFVIIGAMKCATSTLHDQLAAQPGVFMSTPKEPNFFSDDDAWQRGVGWYRSLFADAPGDAICGESSTHYTKLPTHPAACHRMFAHLPGARLIYVMRDPVDRIVSQYVHAWSVRETTRALDEEVLEAPEYVAYSSYFMQLEPWISRYGRERILPVFFERLTRQPAIEFGRICAFLGIDGGAWDRGQAAKNVSSERQIRKPGLDRFLDIDLVKKARRSLIPESVRDRIKSRWRMTERPELSDGARQMLAARLDPDLEKLGALLGLPLTCASFAECVSIPESSPGWVAECKR